MTPADQQKVRRLLALALDDRGSEQEADAAAVKAIQICRAHKVALDQLGEIVGFTVPTQNPGFDDEQWLDAQQRVGQFIDNSIRRATKDFFELLNPRRPRRQRRAA